MSPRLTRFRRSVASLVLAFAVLAGLAAAAYGLVGSTARSSRTTPGVAAVRAPGPTPMLALGVVASHHSVTIGGTVRYRLRITRACIPVRLCGRLNQYHAVRVWLRWVNPIPAGLTARFTRSVTRARTTSLVLGARTTARSGKYRVRLLAATSPQPGRGHIASAVVTLTVQAHSSLALGITGSPATVLLPGGVAGIDLALTNRRPAKLVVTSVVVSVSQVLAPRADAAHPCTSTDFAVSQLAGFYQLVLAPGSTRTLGQLGVVSGQWPAVRMLDRPVNQDGCEGASVVLSYTGTASG
jgi:hypothetical protein